MKNLILFLLCISQPAFAQEKGVTPLTPPSGGRGATRAVVVGISDYQDPAIPDLQFADRDAAAFAEWLKSPAGGGVPEDNIQLLVNGSATNAQISLALYWLVDSCKAGETAIIYFSGHGDLDSKKLREQWGYLLTYDTPAKIYSAGAYPLNYLQNLVSTLSLDQQVRVELFLDACHTGKLAGESVGGGQATAQSLTRQFANEVKVLSCQPNEYSLEGRQWGGGRGVFSYHLLEGLTGLADKNGDGAVSLNEIDRYLGDIVPAETAPQQQTPLTFGDRNFTLARVDAPSLAQLREAKIALAATVAPLGIKGVEDEVLARADSAARSDYYAFKNALKTGSFLDPPAACADFYFLKLIENETFKPLFGLMQRNFAAALVDDAQRALNALLSDDPYEVNNWLYNPAKYKDYPRYLRRSIELLSEKHYMYPTLRAKELYFEGYQIAQGVSSENATAAFRDSVRLLAKEKMLAAIAFDPQAAYLYYSVGHLYWYNTPPRTDSLVVWAERAIERAPQWLMPYLEVAYEYNVTRSEPEKSEPWLKKAAAISPNSYFVQERLSWLYQWLNRTEESLALSEKMITERPELFNAYSTAGVTCVMRKEFDRAERYFEKSLAIEPGINNWANTFNIFLLAKTRRQRAAFILSDSIFNNPVIVADYRESSLAYLFDGLLANRQYDLAAWVAEKALNANLNLVAGYQADAECAIGITQIRKGNHQEGMSWLQKACKSAPLNDAPLLMLRQYAAIVAQKEGRPAQADSLFRSAFGYRLSNLSLDNRLIDYTASLREDYGRFLLAQKRWDAAAGQFQKLLEEEPESWRGYFCMALFHAQQGHEKPALDWLEMALDHWLPTAELALEEPLFKKIRKTKRFKAMMLKNFPPGWENR